MFEMNLPDDWGLSQVVQTDVDRCIELNCMQVRSRRPSIGGGGSKLIPANI